LLRLASNCDPPDLCLLSRYNYRYEPWLQAQISFFLSNTPPALDFNSGWRNRGWWCLTGQITPKCMSPPYFLTILGTKKSPPLRLSPTWSLDFSWKRSGLCIGFLDTGLIYRCRPELHKDTADASRSYAEEGLDLHAHRASSGPFAHSSLQLPQVKKLSLAQVYINRRYSSDQCT
jgi:hypothetical protein